MAFDILDIFIDKKYHYFVSYSRSIYFSAVKPLVESLENLGFSVWIDKTEVPIGIDIYKNIHEVMSNSKSWFGAIVFLDITYFEKSWCLFELDYLLENNVPFIPILHNIDKSDIPEKYKILKKLNYGRSCCNIELCITVNKVIDTFLAKNTIKNNTVCIESETLNTLIFNYVSQQNNSKLTVLNAYNISTYIQTYLHTKTIYATENEQILFNIIQAKMFYLLETGETSRHDIIIVKKAISKIFDLFSLVPLSR